MPHARRPRPVTPRDEEPDLVREDESVGSTSRLEASQETPSISDPGASSSTRTRGRSRGLQTQAGEVSRPQVQVPAKFYGAVGPNATKFAVEADCRVRHNLNMNFDRWSSIPAAEKASLMESMKAKFDFVGDDKVVDAVITTKLSTRARQHKYELHKKYKKLVELHGKPYARSHPPPRCDPVQWEKMVDDMWATEKYQRKSATCTANRSRATLNHACGSKSLAVRANEKITPNGGELGSFNEFFRETRTNAKTRKWATPACNTLHDEMKAAGELRSLQSESVPFTPEEMSRMFLHPRSGIVKGLGMRPSSSLSSTRGTSSSQSAKIAELQQEMDARDSQIKEMQERIKRQQQQIDFMMDYIRSTGYHGPPPP